MLLPYSFGVQKSEMGFTGLLARCQQGCIPSGGFMGVFVSLPFQFLEAILFWLAVPAHQFDHSDLCFISPSPMLSLTPLLPSFRFLVITFGPLT